MCNPWYIIKHQLELGKFYTFEKVLQREVESVRFCSSSHRLKVAYPEFRTIDPKAIPFAYLSRLGPPSSKCVPLFGSALLFSTACLNLRPGLTTITGTGECDRQYLDVGLVFDSAKLGGET